MYECRCDERLKANAEGRTSSPAHVSAHDPQLSLSPSHYFLSDLMENTTSKTLLGY
jgi:hypothetical protein